MFFLGIRLPKYNITFLSVGRLSLFLIAIFSSASTALKRSMSTAFCTATQSILCVFLITSAKDSEQAMTLSILLILQSINLAIDQPIKTFIFSPTRKGSERTVVICFTQLPSSAFIISGRTPEEWTIWMLFSFIYALRCFTQPITSVPLWYILTTFIPASKNFFSTVRLVNSFEMQTI